MAYSETPPEELVRAEPSTKAGKARLKGAANAVCMVDKPCSKVLLSYKLLASQAAYRAQLSEATSTKRANARRIQFFCCPGAMVGWRALVGRIVKAEEIAAKNKRAGWSAFVTIKHLSVRGLLRKEVMGHRKESCNKVEL